MISQGRLAGATWESRLHVENGVAEAAGVRLATCEGTGPNPWPWSSPNRGRRDGSSSDSKDKVEFLGTNYYNHRHQ